MYATSIRVFPVVYDEERDCFWIDLSEDETMVEPRVGPYHSESAARRFRGTLMRHHNFKERR